MHLFPSPGDVNRGAGIYSNLQLFFVLMQYYIILDLLVIFFSQSVVKHTIEWFVVSQDIASQLSLYIIPTVITNSNIGSIDTDFNVGLNNQIEALDGLIGSIACTYSEWCTYF